MDALLDHDLVVSTTRRSFLQKFPYISAVLQVVLISSTVILIYGEGTVTIVTLDPSRVC